MKNKWISVNKKTPSDNREVLVYAPDCNVIGSILIGCYFDDSRTWTVYDFGGSDLNALVTHWQELPPKPQTK